MAKPVGEDRGELGQPPGVNQAHVDQITQVRAVLVAEGCQFDPHQGIQRDDAKRAGVLGLADIRIGQGFVRPDLLVSENDTHGIAGPGGGTVQEHIKAGHMAVDEANRLERGPGSLEVSTADQHIDVLGITDSGFVDTRDPESHRVATGYGVGHLSGAKGRGNPK